jgi:hypothetical protein
MRALAAALALSLITAPALAASPKVEDAIKVLKAVAADPQKLKAFCELSELIGAMGDKVDPAAEAKMDGYFDILGPDFGAAWEVVETTDEKSPDGQALEAAIEELEGKCGA